MPNPPTSEQARLVMELRKRSGLGLMECKLVLSENDWNLEKAINSILKRSNPRYTF